MKNFFRKLLVVCSLAAPAVGFAADWKSDGMDGQYDAASLVERGNAVEVWVRTPNSRSAAQRFSVDCKGSTMRLMASYEIVGGAAKDNMYRYGSAQEPRPIPPGTRGEKVKEIVCKPWYWPF